MADDITRAIAGLTNRLSMLRWRLSMERTMKMDRLSEKLAKAGGVVARQTAKIEARADAIIARESAIEAKTDQAFSPHEAILSSTEKGLDGLDRQLALVSNGGPLELSTASPVAPVPPPAPPPPADAPEARPATWNFDR